MSAIAEVERELSRLRRREGGGAELRTSVMTHVAWVPPEWADAARRTLEGLAERHPSRTILLVAAPDAPDGIETAVDVRRFAVPASTREVCSEVIEIRLGGERSRAPASLVLPLLIPDLPAFCRWRGEPPWGETQLDQLVEVCDRLVVDSAEWAAGPEAYGRLAELFDRIAVSDIAWARTREWRVELASLWPDVASVERLAVRGPRSEAHLLAGWLRSRLGRDVELDVEAADALEAVEVDGRAVAPPRQEPPTPSDLLSAELDVFTRDRVYEAAARAA